MSFTTLPWSRRHTIPVRHENNPFTSLQHEVNRLFDEFFGGVHPTSVQPSSVLSSDVAATFSSASLSPAIDIIENEESFDIHAELPGLNDEDIDVTINDSFITIKAQKNISQDDEDENFIRRERFSGVYQRTIALPATADADEIQASFKQGVLSIEVPKKAESLSKTRKVDVKNVA